MNLKAILFALVQCTWGILQTLTGLLLFLFSGRRFERHFHGAVVCLWRYPFSASLGLFIFLSQTEKDNHRLLTHEYGHCIQSLMLGVFYLPLVMLVSVLWLRLPVCRKRRERTGMSYYSFITERTADKLGQSALQKHR